MATAPLRPHLVSSRPPARLNPLTLWHLLSLDAPTVAALWTWFVAHARHVALPWTAVAAMFAAVWLLYATDRILDARLLEADARHPSHLLEARHRFHHRHRRIFLTGIVLASVTLAALLPRLDPEAMKLYLIEGSFLAGYFILIHATRAASRLPKELAVGLFFAAAVFIPTIVRRPETRPSLIVPALLFAALCSLNCLYIYAWEHPAALRSHHEIHPATLFVLRHLKGVTLALLIAALLVTLLVSSAIPSAVVTSTLALVLLDRQRYRLSRITLRAAADLALLTPLLLLWR